MAEPETIALTYLEGQALLTKCAIKLPAQMGSENFDLEQRANADDGQAVLRAALREVSPLVREDHRPLFGAKEAWEQSADSKNWTLKKDWEQKLVEVKFSEDALYGGCWTIFIGLHPECPKYPHSPVSMGFTVQEVDDTVWGLAKKLGWEPQLRKMLKIEKRRGQTFTRETAVKA